MNVTDNSFSLIHVVAVKMRAVQASWTLLVWLLALPAAGQADFSFTTNADGLTLTITGYTGFGGDLTIPDTIQGLAVTGIGTQAFASCAGLTSVAFPITMTDIGDEAFSSCISLNSATIPDNVTNIGYAAFSSCSNLTTIAIPDNVLNIGDLAFDNCVGLTNVTIGKGVTSIGDRVFVMCSSLTEITVDALNTVYSSLDGVLFDKNQTTLIECMGGKAGAYAIPDGVTFVGNEAFTSCFSLTSITIPDSLTDIGDNAFNFCWGLTNVMIGNGVNFIGDVAFRYCTSLAGAYFQGDAPTAFSWVFMNCDNATVYYLWGTAGWDSTFGSRPAQIWWPYNYTTNNGAITITAYIGTSGQVAIPDTLNGLPVTSIGPSAFASFKNLSRVTIPISVTNIGSFAFDSCTNLTQVNFEGNAPDLGMNAFNNDTNATVYYVPDTTGWDSTFGGCPTGTWWPYQFVTNNGAVTITAYIGSSSHVTIPSAIYGLPVTGIGTNAFYQCYRLISVTIPDSVNSIGDGAFSSSSSLISVTIGNNVSSIGVSAFEFCGSLAAIMVDAGNADYSSVAGVLYDKSQTLLIKYPAGGSGSYTIPSSVGSIGDAAFSDCSSLTNITIPSSVSSIGSNAFTRCNSLSAITVDPLNSVYSSLDGVLFNQSQTTLLQCPEGKTGSYTVPHSVTNVGYAAFSDCTGLIDITIPDGVTSIGTVAFSGCTGLVGVYFQGSAPSIDASAFSRVNNATVYYLPGTTGWVATLAGCPTAPWPVPDWQYMVNGSEITITGYTGPGGDVTIPVTVWNLPVTTIGDSAFAGCTSLTTVIIPMGVTSIGRLAFFNCPGLSSITIPASATNIEFGAFSVCSSLSAITVDPDNPVYSSVSGILFDKSQSTLIQYPGGETGSYSVPGTVLSIGNEAFQASSLTSVIIPHSVTNIGYGAFIDCTGLINITIPGGVAGIGASAFTGCTSLVGVYFQGNAPTVDANAFFGINTTIYYLPGNIGWGPTFNGLPALLWNPSIQFASADFGMQTNGFSFTITGSTNIPVLVEACGDLAGATWISLQTCLLTNGSINFSDPSWTNYSARFYRIRSP